MNIIQLLLLFNYKIMKKWLVFALALGILSPLVTWGIYAYQWPAGQDMDSELRDAIKEAFVNEDYDALQSVIDGTDLFPNMTEEKFAEAIIRHTEMVEKREIRITNKEEIRDCIENLDYDKWKTLAHKDILEIVNTKDKFLKLTQMHEHMEAAKIIREELWLPEKKYEIKKEWNKRLNPEIKNQTRPKNIEGRFFDR